MDDSKGFKYMWWSVFMLGLGMTVYSVLTLVSDFLKFDVTTVVTMKQEESFDFPSLTFCNKNLVHCGRLLKTILECEKVRTFFD